MTTNTPVVKMRKFKQNQKVRVVTGVVHFYTTVKAIENRSVGDSVRFNNMLQAVLGNLKVGTGTGIFMVIDEIPIQMDLIVE